MSSVNDAVLFEVGKFPNEISVQNVCRNDGFTFWMQNQQSSFVIWRSRSFDRSFDFVVDFEVGH